MADEPRAMDTVASIHDQYSDYTANNYIGGKTIIRLTSLYKIGPLEPHFYVVKLWFVGYMPTEFLHFLLFNPGSSMNLNTVFC